MKNSKVTNDTVEVKVDSPEKEWSKSAERKTLRGAFKSDYPIPVYKFKN